MDVVYPLATTTWDEAEYAALQKVIESGRFTMGPLVREFEERFAAAMGARRAVMVNSGSSANLIAVAAALVNPDVDLNPGDEVIVPAVSWATTYYPVHQLGLRLRFVDVDRDTLNIDTALVAEAITERTKAILAVNLLGNPADLPALRALAEAHGLVLIEDNCESLGATLDGRHTGTFGLAGTYSAFFSHHISTMEGGLVTTDDEYTYQAAVSLRAHGWTRELPADNLIHPKSGDAFDDLFRFVLPGYNVRPLEMSGALGIEQLAKLPALIAGRRENGREFVRLFGDRDDLTIQRENGESSWFGFAMVLEGRLGGRRAELARALAAAGIEARPVVAGNFTRNPVMRHLDAIVPDTLPVSDDIHENGLFVGNHHYPIPRQLELLATVVDGL
ncbi:DegT/DnrJ/EryC1/StrS family aminotransferase [Microbacterium sp. 2C]|uniref:DegT/DnrJ/EryC1/StrS family aminotransferase n=1 Tax=Microbacterium paulum TaxID=2707006 RepID=UPI0018C29424|nr:DegT/DnrJ/EryC1/StrS family aminotransferase [Microbacterium paulum]MBG0717944.1 DegT/DnrJ/EryC1/StrS family aminotransferase [Microbacterium paulum]